MDLLCQFNPEVSQKTSIPNGCDVACCFNHLYMGNNLMGIFTNSIELDEEAALHRVYNVCKG